jgi:hypothetical protein
MAIAAYCEGVDSYLCSDKIRWISKTVVLRHAKILTVGQVYICHDRLETCPTRSIAMLQYELIETEEGLAVAEIMPSITSEEAARRRGGLLIDPGPYETYEDAYDALMALKLDEEEDLD